MMMIYQWMKNKQISLCSFIIGSVLSLTLSGCQGSALIETPTVEALFLPPTSNPATSFNPGSQNPPPPTRQVNCQNQLDFIEDLTIPDGSEIAPGEKITKRWLVTNSGTCNWDQSYSLQLISGLALGAETIQQLYPARQNSEFVLEIVYTAPDNPGRYNSWWQAYDPDGGRFGDPLYMDIAVIEQ